MRSDPGRSQALDPQGRGESSPFTGLRLQFRASSGTLGLSWKWKGAPWGGRSSSVAPRRRPEPWSGALHRLPQGGDSSGAWSLTSRISMDRVPVAVLGGEAAGRTGLVSPRPTGTLASPRRPARWSPQPRALGQQRGPRPGSGLTIVLGQDDGAIPAILEEGGCGAEHTLRLDLASGPVHVQPVFRVVVLGVAVGGQGSGWPWAQVRPQGCVPRRHTDTSEAGSRALRCCFPAQTADEETEGRGGQASCSGPPAPE